MNISATQQCPRAKALVVAVVLAFAGNVQAQNSFSSLFDKINDARKRVEEGISGVQRPAQTSEPPSPPSAATLPRADQAGQTGQAVQADQQKWAAKSNIAPLFGRTITGADLYATLVTIRQEAQVRRSAQAWAVFGASLDSTLKSMQQSGGDFNASETLGKLATEAVLNEIKKRTSEVAMKALDEHLEKLLDDRNGLAQESITLPALSSLRSEAQAKRIVTLATLVVAARLSGKVLNKAQDDFKSLQKDYSELMKQREQAATLLYNVLLTRRTAQQQSDNAGRDAAEAELKQGLSAQDLAFIDNDIGRLSVGDFEKDMGAQNLAIAYLRTRDADAYKTYNTQAKDFLVRSRAYVRTVSGVAAFGGLMVSFAQIVDEFGRDRQGSDGQRIGNVLQAMPLGFDFLKATASLLPLVVSTTLHGAVLEPVRNGDIGGRIGGAIGDIFKPKPDLFVVSDEASMKKVKTASDVYEALQGKPSETLLQDSLFRNGSTGFLAQVGRCDPGEAGRMIDSVVPKDQRSSFARDYLNPTDPKQADDFSFVNQFELLPKTALDRRLNDAVLGTDHRMRSPEPDPKRREALSSLQKSVAVDYRKWNNDQLTRLIFANREGNQVQYATLQLGSVQVRPVPSMQALYVYESQANACKRTLLEATADTPAPTPSPAAKPKTRITTAKAG